MSTRTQSVPVINPGFRVGLLFDVSPLGQACWEALSGVCVARRWSLSDLATVAEENCDVFLLFGDEVPAELPAHIFPCALWIVDSALDLSVADQYDWVFTSSIKTFDALQRADVFNRWMISAPDAAPLAQTLGQLLGTVTRVPGMPARYFRLVRQEILEAIPSTACRILDVGCAAGKLGQTLKDRQSCHVTGVEIHPGAAALAQAVLDEVMDVDIDTALDALTENTYDCIIVADIIEHLFDPWTTLRKLVSKLQPSGASRLIISLPNVAHWSVVLSLLNGEWQYTNAGILDSTHLRFFTPASAQRLIHGSNLLIEEARGVLMPPPAALAQPKINVHHGWGNSQLSDVYQMIYICRRNLEAV